MILMSEALQQEFSSETRLTRRLLERLPDGKADWKPHPKSMALGRLAAHLGEIPAFFRATLEGDLVVEGFGGERRVVRSADEALALFDAGSAAFAETLAATDDARLQETWRFIFGGRVVMERPRYAAVRELVLSHSIHHRGQLGVYLRLLDVPLPSVYGPSADERM
jgi:uncharacterized damage-inducible protein DinB